LWPESISSPQSSVCCPFAQKPVPNSVQSRHDRRRRALAKLVDLDPERAGFGVVPGEALQRAHQR
jgi:hypothetical protein